MDIDVSVVIPAYNRSKTIERAIRSVYSQTVPPLEVIVVDDASTDNTVQIVEHLQQEFDSLRLYVQKENKGAQEARNVGIKNAKGNWIGFLDSDDEWLPKKQAIQIELLRKNPQCKAVFGNGYTAIGNAVRYRKGGSFDKEIYSLKDIFCSEVGFPTILVKKDVLVHIGYLDSKVPAYQEVDTKLRIAGETDFIFDSRPIYKYHMHSGATISKDTKRNTDGFRYVVLKNMNLISGIDGIDIVEYYLSGMDDRAVNRVDKFVYHGLHSLYHLRSGDELFRKVMIGFMRLEFKLRYK
ncbi:glycosyltransferase family 2 protein [Butyrivibrio proteoclasticus]|uniref:glycosyltransferase family 2 protein n=1 Tax=Butyrivibrio proteoclasticus TaxID=43305 RepID=UPI000A449B64|nr:glycosyltransferase family 2 protein [Butyrivibrio proteoclasticus]